MLYIVNESDNSGFYYYLLCIFLCSDLEIFMFEPHAGQEINLEIKAK